ncbi:hypothetical protein RBH20_09700 [Haloarcula sp. H-GB4]|uniref:hypothetical protein n=1 Tax=Haloarcula sp. H-GB4 TaxID=3069755 RepID=UPI0027B411D3|nr:hypothetical protein [Haloarcula sp. H-GB4]MDQ2072807.1 hypothetical protein [Haloarcula sp. H-GB4]
MTAECHLCGGPPDNIDGNSYLCDDCLARLEGRTSEETTEADVDETAPSTVGTGILPTNLEDRERWIAWKETDDGRKVPRAPWETGGDAFVSAQDSDVWVDLATAEAWLDKLSGFDLAYNIPDRDDHETDLVLIDYDDARNPETGDIHATVREHIDRADSYADVSTSGTGVHILCRGQLPDGVKSIEATLPEDEAFPDAEIEVYDSARFVAMTGTHIASTPAKTTRCQQFIDDLADDYTTVAEGTPDELIQEPEKTAAEIADVETTSDMQDVLDAIQHTGPRDIRLRSTVTQERSDGTTSMDPSWAQSKSGTRLAQVGDSWVYRKGMVGLDALQVVALEERIITTETEYPSGEAFWQAVEALRGRGAHIPEFEPSEGDIDHTAVLPDSLSIDTSPPTWDWQNPGHDDNLSIGDARARTTEKVVGAYQRNDQVLIEALPTMGKSYGSIAAAAETGEPVTVLTGRGRKEQYAQFKEWCETHGLTYKELPSFTHDCPTAAGDHGEEWRETVMDWYRRGATPKAIHKFAEDVLGKPLPCQVDDEGNHVGCQYAHLWNFDPETDGSTDPDEDVAIDVLIGHYTHAYKEKVTTGRTVVFDEFPDGAYETTLAGDWLQGAVSYWLSTVDAVSFDDYTDLIENRDDDGRRADALAWFLDDSEEALDTAESLVFDDDSAHAAAPLAAFAILAGDDLGNGFEAADLQNVGAATFDRETGQVSLLQPPSLDYTSGIVALDGTPTKRMWELSLGVRLHLRPVLSKPERSEYISEVLNLNLVRTTDAVKPYNSADHVTVEQDAALLEGIADAHGERPSLITSSTAEGEYDAAGVADLVDETKHYGNVLGSNEFKERRLGAVIGSNHYGDRFIKKWGAYAGEAVERNAEKGAGLSYTGFGDRVLTHMREHDTLQAAMRFGRDGNGAVVYVHTDTLPDWVPIADEGHVLTTWSDGMRQVVAAAADLKEWTTADLAAHPDVDIGERQVRAHLTTLAENHDVVAREAEGCAFVWRDNGLHRLGDHGEVKLTPIDLDDLSNEESAELARSSTYTWQFRTPVETQGMPTPDRGGSPGASDNHAATGGGPPPNESD